MLPWQLYEYSAAFLVASVLAVKTSADQLVLFSEAQESVCDKHNASTHTYAHLSFIAYSCMRQL